MNSDTLLKHHGAIRKAMQALKNDLQGLYNEYIATNRPFDVGATLNGEFHVGKGLCNGDWLVTFMYLTIASEMYRFWPQVPQLHIGLQYMQAGRPDNSIPETTAVFTQVNGRWEPGCWTLETDQHTWTQAGQHYIVKE